MTEKRMLVQVTWMLQEFQMKIAVEDWTEIEALGPAVTFTDRRPKGK